MVLRKRFGLMVSNTVLISVSLLSLFSWGPVQSEEVKPEPSSETKGESAAENQTLCERYLPYGDVFTEKELVSRFKRALVEPLGDKELSFAVLLPKDWLPVNISVSEEQLAKDKNMQIPLLAVSPVAPKPEVFTQVRYMRVPEHVSPSDFLDVYARKFDAQIICRQHAELNNRSVEDALMRLNIEGLGDSYMRITITRKGERVFFISSSAPVQQYENWKKTFAVSAVSFNPDK